MINEIAQILREKSLSTAFPLSLATIDDIIDAQEAILIHIPIEFRDYLLHCSDVIFGNLEPVTVADPMSHTYLPEVAAEAWSQGMPREYVPLCKIDGGVYCVNEDDTVFLWHEGEDEPEEVGENIWAWVRDVWLNETD